MIAHAGMIVTLTVPPGSDMMPSWECQGYTLDLNGETWRGILRDIRQTGDGLTELEVMLSDRTPVGYH